MMEIGRGGAYVPARVALQEHIHHLSLRMMRVFLVWKRPYGFVWVDCVCGFVCLLGKRCT